MKVYGARLLLGKQRGLWVGEFGELEMHSMLQVVGHHFDLDTHHI